LMLLLLVVSFAAFSALVVFAEGIIDAGAVVRETSTPPSAG